MNKWNEFFEKQANDDLKASLPPNPFKGDVSETETEKAGENAEKALNEQNETESETENETEKKGTEENESSEHETGRKETETV